MCRKCRHLSEGKFSFGSLFDNDTKQTNLASTVKWLAQKNCKCMVPVRFSRVRKHSKLNFRFDLKKFSTNKKIFLVLVFAMCTFHLSAARCTNTYSCTPCLNCSCCDAIMMMWTTFSDLATLAMRMRFYYYFYSAFRFTFGGIVTHNCRPEIHSSS